MTHSDTQIPELIEEFQTALAASNMLAAVEASAQIQQTEVDIDGLLNDFEAAIDEDNTTLAQLLLLELNNAYADRVTEEEAETQQAVTAIEEGNLVESDRETMFELLSNQSHASLIRSNFLTVAISYLESSEGESATDVTEAASTARDAEESLTTARDGAASVAESVDIGATPAILNVDVPPEAVVNETISVLVTIGNVGDGDTSDLSIRVLSSDTVTPTADSTSIGTLSGNTQSQTPVEVQLSGTAEVTVEVALSENGDTVDSSTATVSIADSASTVREAISGDSAENLTAVEIQQAISFWRNDTTVPGTGGETVATDQLQAFITEWLEEDADDQ